MEYNVSSFKFKSTPSTKFEGVEISVGNKYAYLDVDNNFPKLDEHGEAVLIACYTGYWQAKIIHYITAEIQKCQEGDDVIKERRITSGIQDFYLELGDKSVVSAYIASVVAFLLTFKLEDPRLEYIATIDDIYEAKPELIVWIKSNSGKYVTKSIQKVLRLCISFSYGSERLFTFAELSNLALYDVADVIVIKSRKMVPVYKDGKILLFGNNGGYSQMVIVDGAKEYGINPVKSLLLMPINELVELADSSSLEM